MEIDFLDIPLLWCHVGKNLSRISKSSGRTEHGVQKPNWDNPGKVKMTCIEQQCYPSVIRINILLCRNLGLSSAQPWEHCASLGYVLTRIGMRYMNRRTHVDMIEMTNVLKNTCWEPVVGYGVLSCCLQHQRPYVRINSSPSCFNYDPVPCCCSWESSGEWPKCLVPCHSCVGLAWGSSLLTLAWLICSHCNRLETKPVDESLSLSLPLSLLSLCLPINNKKEYVLTVYNMTRSYLLKNNEIFYYFF